MHVPAALLPPVSILLTIGSYLIGRAVYARVRSPLANPVLIAIVLVGVAIRLLGIPYPAYFEGAQSIHFLLGPATVVLAIPLVRSMHVMRERLVPMLLALVAGGTAGFLLGPVLVRLCGGSESLALSMAPKSLTTPIAIGVAQTIGGNGSLSAIFAIVAGIVVAVVIDPLLQLCRITDSASKGLAAGTAGSGIGAAQVIPQHAVAAAFAGVAIGLNGLITALLAPVLTRVLLLF